MANQRDEFSSRDKLVLAQRVGYVCSNPHCTDTTVGPHSNPVKVLLTGVGSHITAAAVGGPRYNPNLTPSERKSINNGIWLCATCGTLIDKDPASFPEPLIREWKQNAEEAMRLKQIGRTPAASNKPILEAELILAGSSRGNEAYSDQNPVVFENGHYVRVLQNPPIIHWHIEWRYKLTIHNNSSYPAFNVGVTSVGEQHFNSLDKLPKINNIPPLGNVVLKATFEHRVDGPHTVADEIHHQKIPLLLNGVQLDITYLDESRFSHLRQVAVLNGELLNL